MRTVTLFSLVLFSGIALGHGRPPMGSVVNGHHFHGYPRGVAAGVYVNPYVYWNGVGYTFGYGPVYGYGNRYGAISYSSSTGANGWGTGFNDLYSAQNEAYLNCAATAGDCQNLMWFANTCAALSISATNKSAVGWAWNASSYVAAVNAQTQCGYYASDCVTQYQICSY